MIGFWVVGFVRLRGYRRLLRALNLKRNIRALDLRPPHTDGYSAVCLTTLKLDQDTCDSRPPYN